MTDGIYGNMNFIPTFQPNSYKSKADEAKAAEEKAKKAEELEKKKAEELEKKKAEEAAKKMQRESELDMLKKQLENSHKEAESAAEGFAAFGKCLTIAQRITRGDNVPIKDMKYLMEHEPDLYKQAIMLRQPNDDPKDYDSVLEEEDTENETSEASDSTATTPPVAEGAVEVSAEATASE